MDPARDLGAHCYAQAQAWNTQQLWAKKVSILDNAGKREGRGLLHAIDKCFAPTIDNSAYDHIDVLYFVPNFISVLQPVGGTIGRSFKAAFQRLLVSHVLNFVNKEKIKDPAQRRTFKITVAVSIYDALNMMRTAWEMVPRKVVLKSWLCGRNLSPYHELLLQDAVQDVKPVLFKANLRQRGRHFDTDMVLYHQRLSAAKEKDTAFLQALEGQHDFTWRWRCDG